MLTRGKMRKARVQDVLGSGPTVGDGKCSYPLARRSLSEAVATVQDAHST